MRRDRLSSISAQGVIYFSSFAVALLFLVSIPIFLYGRNLLQETVASDLMAVSLEKKEQILAWFDESISDLRNLTTIDSVVSYIMQANAAAPEDRAQLYQLAVDQISGWAGGTHFFDSLFILDAETGQIMASTNPEDVGKFREDQSFFQQGLIEAYIQPPTYSMETGTAQIIAGAPVRAPSGETIAVLGAQLSLAQITEITQRHIYRRETGDAFLVNQANLPLTQPRFITTDAIMQRGIFTDAVELCINGGTGSILADDYRGIPAIISYTWIPDYGICLINKIDQAEAYHPILKFGLIMLLVTAVALAAGFLISAVFTRRVALPITRLATAAEKIGDGDFDVRVNVENPYEVAVTAKAFNHMAEALQQRMDDLSTLFGIVESLSGEQDEARLISRLVDLLKQFIGVDSVLWSTFDAKKKGLTIVVHTGVSESFFKKAKFTSLGTGLMGKALSSGQPQVIHTVEDYTGVLKAALIEEEIQSAAAVPVTTGDHFWGALGVGSYQKGYFSPERVDLMMAVGRHLAIALDRVSLYQKSRENEERFKRLSEATFETVVITDAGVVVDHNDQFLTLFGIRKGSPIGRKAIEFIHPEDRDEVAENMAKGYEGAYEVRGRRVDGSIFMAQIKGRLIDFGGRKLRMAAIRDITEWKRNEADLRQARDGLEMLINDRTTELRRKEAILRSLLNTMTESALLIDLDGEILGANNMAASRLGVSPDNLLGNNLFSLLDPGIVKDRQQKVRKVIRSCTPVRFVEEHGDRTIDHNFSPVMGPDGKVEAVAIFGIDITDIKQAERELYSSRQMLQLVLDAIPQRVFWKDRQLRYLGFNQAFVKAMKLDNPNGLIGKDDSQLVHWMNTEYFQQDDMEVMQSGMQRPVREEHLIADDGTSIWQRSSKAPLFDQNGKVIGVLGTNEDITDKKLAEEQLKQTMEDLARSNSELEQFAYVASHDLQEPLRMVTSYLQLIERRYKDKLDAEADEFIGFAVDGAMRMKGLINDLLLYSRVSTRGKEFELTDVKLVVKRVLHDLSMQIEESNALIEVDRLPKVMADEIQLGQVFQNLISNAIKFRSEAPIEIHIGASHEKHNWIFWVCDNGIGIEPQYHERIFVIFQRLHARGEFPGTGIGLAIVKKIIERHGGRIWLESQPGYGSTFYFSLPERGTAK